MGDQDALGLVVAIGVFVLCCVITLVFIGLVIGLIVLVSQYANAEYRRQTTLWASFASSRGIGMQGRFPRFSLHGALDGAPFTFRQHRVRRGKHTHTHSEVTVPVPVATGDLQIASEGVLEKIGKVFGLGDIQLGDPAFDGAFVVTTSQPDRARSLVTQAARDALRGAARALPGGALSLSANTLRHQRQAGSTPEELAYAVAVLTQTAATLGVPR